MSLPPYHLAESEYAERALPGRHGNALPREDALVPIQIVRGHRLLDPCDLQRLELPAHRDGGRGIVGAVDIYHEVHGRPDRLANGSQRRDIHAPAAHLRAAADLHFDGGVAPARL